MMRSVPPARPGIAASQKSWPVVSWKPRPGSRTTSALTTNQVMKASVRLKVVTVRVRQARVPPSVAQKVGFSGVQRSSQVPPRPAAGDYQEFCVGPR